MMRIVTFLTAIIALSACATPGTPTPIVLTPVAVAINPIDPAKPAATPAPSPQPSVPKVTAVASLDPLKAIVTGSACAKFSFAEKGRARPGFLKGIAIVYARAICSPDRPEAKILSGPPGSNDALALYGIKSDPLQATYALMVGLAARESDWTYCCGRDMSSGFSSASSAEAGFLQTSYGARLGKGGVPRAGGALNDLYLKWKTADHARCLTEVFAEGVSAAYCAGSNAKNWGDGEGFLWQKLTKTCPVFAAEYGALVMRFNGGPVGEFGPLRTKKAIYSSACFDMFGAVRAYVAANPSVCNLM